MAGNILIKEGDFSLAAIDKAGMGSAFVGNYAWGQVGEPYLIVGGKKQFKKLFGRATNDNVIAHLMVKDHLRSGYPTWVNRGVGAAATNATSTGIPTRVDNSTAFATLDGKGAFVGSAFIGRFPGTIANGIKVSMVDNANFNNWDYKDSFPYAPRGENLHVAVLDTKGGISNSPARQQKEKLKLNIAEGVAYTSNVTQEESLTVTLPAGGSPAWTSQVSSTVIISVDGTLTAANPLTVLGETITLALTDTPEIITQKIYNELAKNPKYSKVSKSNRRASVKMRDAGPIPPETDITQDGVSIKFRVIQGNKQLKFKYAGQVGEYVYDVFTATPKHEDGIAKVLSDMMNDNSQLKVGIADVATNVVTLKRSAIGPVSKFAESNQNGIKITPALLVQGSIDVPISYAGLTETVTINNAYGDISISDPMIAKIVADPTVEKVDRNPDNSIIISRKGLVHYTPYPNSIADGIAFINAVVTSGFSGQIIESYLDISLKLSTRDEGGLPNHWKAVINDQSDYILAADSASIGTTFPVDFELEGGVSDFKINQIPYWEQYKDKQLVPNIRCIVAHSDDYGVLKAANDVAEARKDCVSYISVPQAIIMGDVDSRSQKVKTWMEGQLNINSSYSFIDNQWGQLFDTDTGEFHWIPLCAGTAALVNSLFAKDEFHQSPANTARGVYDAYNAFAWNVTPQEEKVLDSLKVNVVKMVEGAMTLMGDSTTYSAASAFGSINTRNTFIEVEAVIGRLAKEFLFENHNTLTYRRFQNAIEPYLTSIIGDKVEDARWVGDERINTAQDKVNHRLVGACLLKTYYSIHDIEINFLSVRPDVTFTEVEQYI